MEFLENLPIYVATKSGLIYKPKSDRHTATQLDLQYEGYCLNQQRSSFASLIELLEELEHYRALINKEFQDKAAAAELKKTQGKRWRFTFGTSALPPPPMAPTPMETEEQRVVDLTKDKTE